MAGGAEASETIRAKPYLDPRTSASTLFVP
jgi:hypothetical protein